MNKGQLEGKRFWRMGQYGVHVWEGGDVAFSEKSNKANVFLLHIFSWG